MSVHPQIKKPELLAPAGTLDVFEAAINAGADAVYVGAPNLNARALAKQFTQADIAAMARYAHEKGVRLYLAANSLVKESELPQAIELLALAEGLEVDALIVQDHGLARLAREHFPRLRLHASTLMCAHNSDAVGFFARNGFSRIVLARELTLAEIAEIIKKTGAEIEVFVHGALCFSYSGLCLFSSYQGGKSGLRGRCVQPCRRRFSWSGPVKGAKEGYLFSMQDLSGLDSVAELTKIGVSSLKIEGRMRSVNYVQSVVRAYRMVIDAEGREKSVFGEATALLRQAMGRNTTKGYFQQKNPADALAAGHSGNVGQFLGKVESIGANGMRIILKNPVKIGDRLRLHREKSGERQPFTLKNMRVGTRTLQQARKTMRVEIAAPFQAQPGDSLYLVDLQENRLIERQQGAVQKMIKKKGAAVPNSSSRVAEVLRKISRGEPTSKIRGIDLSDFASWHIKISDPDLLPVVASFRPQKIVFALDESTLPVFIRRIRQFQRSVDTIVLSLPPLIDEELLDSYRSVILDLIAQGFKSWQIGHISQVSLFNGTECALSGDYTLNVLNSQTADQFAEYGVQTMLFAVEADHEDIAAVCASEGGQRIGIVAYGLIPLFTARLSAQHFHYERELQSPHHERFFLRRRAGKTLLFANEPFSLVPWLGDLAAAGIKFAVADLSNMRLKKHQMTALLKRFPSSLRGDGDLESFNYRGELL